MKAKRKNVHGGSAGDGGYDYQAEASALISSKILAQESLNWIESGCDRVPVLIRNETGQGGDDIQIILRSSKIIELQAKRGISKGSRLWDALIKIAKVVKENETTYGVLLTNSSASNLIRENLREGIIRVGQGELDQNHEIVDDFVNRLKKEGIKDFSFCSRIRIIIRDLDPGSSGEEETLSALRKVILEPNQAGATRNTLVGDGHDLIKLRGRRDANSIAIKIQQDGIQLRDLLDKEKSQPRKISISLLNEYGRRSLELYSIEQNFILPPDKWVSREINVLPEVQIKPITLLVGDRGFGKSVYAYQMLQKHLNNGEYGVWLSADYIAGSLSINSALDKMFREMDPLLSPEEPKRIIELLPPHSQFLIVVDDLNRLNNAEYLLEKLVNWARTNPKYLIVCPVWPRYWRAVERKLNHNTPWVQTVDVESLTTKETSEVIQSASDNTLSLITLGDLSFRLGGDPFLVGLFASHLLETQPTQPNLLVDKLIEQFIHDKIEEVQEKSNSQLGYSDYQQSLLSLVKQMLQRRNLRPSWPKIRQWFNLDENKIKALWDLCKQEGLCRIEKDEEIFSFRHDRFFDALAVETIIEVLNRETVDFDLLEEPYYAEIVGQAIARHSFIKLTIIRQIGEKSPFALVEAIHGFGEPTTQSHRAIVEEVKKILKRYEHREENAICDYMLWSLLRTDSSAVLEVTENYYDNGINQWSLLARFRNGDTESGVDYCNKFGMTSFWSPSPYGAEWYEILEHVKQHHKDKIFAELKELCSKPSTKETRSRGDLVLAGFIGDAELTPYIILGWNLQQEKGRYLAPVIMACIRCYSPEFRDLMDSILTYWAELPDIPQSKSQGLRESVPDSSSTLLSYGISDAVLNYLIEQAEKFLQLRPLIAQMIRQIDRPNAIEFVIRVASEIKQNTTIEKDLPNWIHFFPYDWHRVKEKGYKLSKASVDKLQTLWEISEDNEIRKLAFQIWLTVIDEQNEEIIKAIPSNSPLFEDALVVRLQHKDESVLPDLIPILTTDTKWFHYAHLIWRDQMLEIANFHLERFGSNIPKDFSGGRLNEHYSLSEFLLRIPQHNAEALLVKNWEYVGYSPLFVWVAISVGTPNCLRLVAENIIKCPGEIDIFDDFFSYLRSCGVKLTLQHLENLIPYIDRFKKDELQSCARICNDLGEAGISWMRQYLVNYLDSEKIKYLDPTPDNLMYRLDDYAELGYPHHRAKEWLEDFNKISIKENPIQVLEKWLASKSTFQRFRFVAACIELIGNRSDLEILNKYKIEYGEILGADWIKESTVFSVKRRTLN